MDIENKLFPNHGKLKQDDLGNLSAEIIDAELDPIECTFNGDGCIQLETQKLAYIILTPKNLKQMAKLILDAEKINQKTC